MNDFFEELSLPRELIRMSMKVVVANKIPVDARAWCDAEWLASSVAVLIHLLLYALSAKTKATRQTATDILADFIAYLTPHADMEAVLHVPPDDDADGAGHGL